MARTYKIVMHQYLYSPPTESAFPISNTEVSWQTLLFPSLPRKIFALYSEPILCMSGNIDGIK